MTLFICDECRLSADKRVCIGAMADSSASTSHLSPSKTSRHNLSESGKEPRKRKNACRVGLYGAFEQWRSFKDEMNLKTDKDVAVFLLNSYYAKNRLW